MNTPGLWDTIQPHISQALAVLVPALVLAALGWIRNVGQKKLAQQAVDVADDVGQVADLHGQTKADVARGVYQRGQSLLTKTAPDVAEKLIAEAHQKKRKTMAPGDA